MRQPDRDETAEGGAVRAVLHRLPAVQRAEAETLTPSIRPPGRRPAWPWLLSGLVLLSDQISKFLLMASLQPGESLPLCSPVLHLTYVQNTGAAFGLFKGQQELFIGLALLVIVWIVWQLIARVSVLTALTTWGYALILGGAVGNLIDRLRVGHVIDFIDLRVWPVFNLGDSAITIGVGLLIIQVLSAPGRGARDGGRGT